MTRSPAGRAIPRPSQATLERLRAAEHPRCLLRGPAGGRGLGLVFEVQPDGAVAATVELRDALEGYPDLLHGGVTAAVLDAAMTNALFSVGVVAVTAELTVRYVAPVRLEEPALVRASVERLGAHALCWVRAELEQRGAVVAHATARFIARRRTGAAARP